MDNINQEEVKILSWEELEALVPKAPDQINGPTNSQSNLRLFGKSESEIRVTLFRDHHAWCPYCQKIWLWLELKKIPYKVEKVTMRCYGNKESWYLKKVPSGMLPAIELDKTLIQESDVILLALESVFGSLGTPLTTSRALTLRYLERRLFQAWCQWLCRRSSNKAVDHARQEQFQVIAKEMEGALSVSEESYLDPVYESSGAILPGSLDVIFIPYLERMNASLAYYKGFNLRKEHPKIDIWFQRLESLNTYRGTQGDFHTHAHDLPPQMGGCWVQENEQQKAFANAIDSGQGLGNIESSFRPLENEYEANTNGMALKRVLKHRQQILEVNPIGSELFDQPLRAALTSLMVDKTCKPNKDSAYGLRYLKDRISVPRDMRLLSARNLRQSLERTASADSQKQGPPLKTNNRFDQDPKPFLKGNN